MVEEMEKKIKREGAGQKGALVMQKGNQMQGGYGEEGSRWAPKAYPNHPNDVATGSGLHFHPGPDPHNVPYGFDPIKWAECQSNSWAPTGTCPMPNSRPLSCQCAYKGPSGCGCSCGHGGQALGGLTYGHRNCPNPEGLRDCLHGGPNNTQASLVGPGHVDMTDGRRPTG